MTGAERPTVGKKKTSLGLVSLMLLSLVSALATVPNAAAIEQVDLAILAGQSPVEDRYYSAFGIKKDLEQVREILSGSLRKEEFFLGLHDFF